MFISARVSRSAPQFAVTLLIYEMLQRFFDIDFGGPTSRANQTIKTKKTAYDEQTLMRPFLLVNRVDKRGGLCIPQFKPKY